MRRLWTLGFLTACASPPTNFTPDATGAGDPSTGVTGTTSTATSSTSAAPTSGDTTGSTSAAVTTDATTTDASGSSFILDPDTTGPPFHCDVYAQDCPAGHKCAWTAYDRGQWWEITTCVPLARDPLPDGAPCEYSLENPFASIDECGLGAMCVEGYDGSEDWDGQATCVSLCKGSQEYPYCDVGSVCIGGRSLYLCTPTCDPLAQDCPAGQRCDFYGAATLCTFDFPDEPRVEVGQPCDWAQDCELGATCIDGATPECGELGCCTPFCDIGDPQAQCPLPGQQCVPPYDWVLPGQAPLGVCRTEVP